MDAEIIHGVPRIALKNSEAGNWNHTRAHIGFNVGAYGFNMDLHWAQYEPTLKPIMLIPILTAAEYGELQMVLEVERV